ncbi:hypothetical protein DXV75_16415 [Alteromonas aestuariivivens]|uniref:DUF4402 domain-containing protein n=1 Tax=Alteromonas aestuariivivens TaxID=1938339 RepID=A0A3D8M2U4_9ALTE|nr:hypothetical protein [Alteromonas aestuariivivens]RDV23948.1 hypothetical protein DXV75_16415 [Alteromonas aestuariivivens]
MKKSLLSILLGASLALSANAQEQAAGASATGAAAGGMTAGLVATGVVATGIAAAMVANNRGSVNQDNPIIEPPPVDIICDGDDPLVDGVCVGTTNTVTVSGTQTVTLTVTFTYAPTVVE